MAFRHKPSMQHVGDSHDGPVGRQQTGSFHLTYADFAQSTGSGLDFLDKVDAETRTAKEDEYEKVRLKLRRFMATSTFGMLYENFFIFICVLSVVEIIYMSYLDWDNEVDRKILVELNNVELCFACLFSMDWGLNFYFADLKLQFCTRWVVCAVRTAGVCCLLSAVCCLLSAVCCLLSAVCCLLSAVCCLLSAV
ncbi:hypothetical protein B484DRAFT_275858, partial [Ochromonadaceae sp. CCMP2298]